MQGEALASEADKKSKTTRAEERLEEKKEIAPVKKVTKPLSEKTSSKKKIILLLVIVAAVIFYVVNLRPLFFPEPIKEEVVIIQEVVPEAPPANAPVKPAPVAAVTSTDCPTADISTMNYKPDAPKKAGDMVYLQSKTAQTVCVVDATGKTQNKLLEPGVGASVYGKPPFKVLTGGLNQVDLYYQGAKVRTGNTSSKTIILEPADIV
uniref:DUF4115 domain-containing protein n=1 Tax=Polynucleobacter necessarius subsp. necessarius (strain STIR1) TaxID=452638 RepID=B1XVE7_POLNS